MYNKLALKNGDKDFIFIDDECMTSVFDYFEWLYSTLSVENNAERRYMRELIENQVSCNFPIMSENSELHCSCDIAVVKVRYYADYVTWEKVGMMKKDWDYHESYRNSGIRRVEDWTDVDWEKYGDIAYDLLQDDYFFNDWCYKNWQEELYRRCWGYYHKYFNNDENIVWVSELDCKFEPDEYRKFFMGNI